MIKRAVFDLHRRLWDQLVPRPLHLCLPQAVDGSVTAIEHAIETTVKVAAVEEEVAVIANVDVLATMEVHMVKVVVVVVDEAVEECGWAVRASDLDGACKHTISFFFFLSFLSFS